MLTQQLSLLAQVIPNVLIKGRVDGEKIFAAYMAPYIQRTGVALNRNWYTTAKAQPLFHVDLAVKLSVVEVSDQSRTYNLNNLDLEILKPSNATDFMAPTLLGNTKVSPKLEVWKSASQHQIYNPVSSEYEIMTDEARSIHGLGKLLLPMGSQSAWLNGSVAGVVPFAQLNLGMPFNTELSLRYVPKTKLESISYHTWGIGIKHDIMQWIMSNFDSNFDNAEDDRPFDLAITAGYTTLTGIYYKPGIALGVSSGGNSAESYFYTQRVKTEFKGFNLELILSKTFFRSLTPFFSFGYAKNNTAISILGKYPVNGITVGVLENGMEARLNESNVVIENGRYIFVDPISFNLSQKEIKVTVGLQYELYNILQLSGGYTAGAYTSYHAGIHLMTGWLFRRDYY